MKEPAAGLSRSLVIAMLLAAVGLPGCGPGLATRGARRSANASLMIVSRGSLEGHIEPSG